jgi:hypothetical protein
MRILTQTGYIRNIRYHDTKSGRPFATFTISSRAPDGTFDTTSCRSFDFIAETVNKNVNEGDTLIVSGPLTGEIFKDKKTDVLTVNSFSILAYKNAKETV